MGKVMCATTCIILFVLALVISGTLVIPAYRKYKGTKQELLVSQAELDRKRTEYLRLQQEVHDLQHKASAIEKVAREQYHLSREGEIVYIYSE